MIELNLLPDVKKEYIRAQRTKRLIISISFICSVAALSVLILLVLAELYQKHTLDNVVSDVNLKSHELTTKPNLDKVLTVQNQLIALNQLHVKKPATTRVFDYLNELTPANVSITSMTIDFNKQTLIISGNALDVASANQFIDTLEFTNYKVGSSTKTTSAFSDIVVSALSQNNDPSNTAPLKASFSLTTSFAPTLFDRSKTISLAIPNQITTRSVLENPGPLFIQGTKSSTSGGTQ